MAKKFINCNRPCFAKPISVIAVSNGNTLSINTRKSDAKLVCNSNANSGDNENEISNESPKFEPKLVPFIESVECDVCSFFS